MYNAASITKGLSLTKIIGGISKTLQVANQVIPLYQKAKPIISNARSIFGVFKEFTKNNSKTIEAKDVEIKSTSPKTSNYDSNQKKESGETITSPTFFL